MRVDVGGDGVRLRAVPLDALGRARVVDRIDHVEQLHRLVAQPQPRERDDGPERRVRVLTAVLADAGQVALDVAGIVGHPVERRRQQQHELRVAPDQMRAHRLHRARGAPRLRRLRQHRPRLRQRVDPAFLVLRRPERRPIVEIRASIPVAVPGQLQHAGEPPRLVPIALRQVAAAPPVAQRARTRSARRPGTIRARRFRRGPRGRRDSCRRSSRRIPSAASRARRTSSSDRWRGANARRATPSRARRTAGRRPPIWSGSSGGASRNGTTSSSTDSSPVRST